MIIINKEERKNKDIKILKKEENRMFLRSKNNTKGITLIALVITIIVLLILAGVTIAMLTGENGILTKTSTAKTETVNKGAIEKVQIAIAGSFDNTGKTDDTQLKTNLGNVEGIEKPIPEITNKFTVVVDGVNIEITKDANGYAKAEIKGETPTPPASEIQPGEIATGGNKNYVESGKTAVIPKGFKVSDVKEEQKIDTGLVVIAPDGSEFVWIPVNKNTLCVDGTAGKEIAEVATGSDYRGVLYDFSGSGDATTSSKRTYSSSGYKEPDVVTSFDGSTAHLDAMNSILGTSFSTIDNFKTYLQEEYNDIIGSIKTNGGYYVGRYESSITGSTETTASTTGDIQSKKGVMPTSANNSVTDIWYGLYAKQKVYAKTEKIKDTGIKSAMITGSMYDGMLNFALNGADKSKITQTVNGNHGGTAVPTGNTIKDSINNIKDLEGNLFEWTSEADGTYYRVLRRGRLLLYRSSQ